MDMKIKECETCGVKYQRCDCFVEYTNFNDHLIEYKCLCCIKNYQHKFNENLKVRFYTYRFSKNDNNKLILLI